MRPVYSMVGHGWAPLPYCFLALNSFLLSRVPCSPEELLDHDILSRSSVRPTAHTDYILFLLLTLHWTPSPASLIRPKTEILSTPSTVCVLRFYPVPGRQKESKCIFDECSQKSTTKYQRRLRTRVDTININ